MRTQRPVCNVQLWESGPAFVFSEVLVSDICKTKQNSVPKDNIKRTHSYLILIRVGRRRCALVLARRSTRSLRGPTRIPRSRTRISSAVSSASVEHFSGWLGGTRPVGMGRTHVRTSLRSLRARWPARSWSGWVVVGVCSPSGRSPRILATTVRAVWWIAAWKENK